MNYKLHVLDSVTAALEENHESAVKLANHLQPLLRTVLARQRRDYEISDEFPPEFPISSLPESVRENALCNNLGMENICGKVGQRAKHNLSLTATSRSILIQGTQALREKYPASIRSFKNAANKVNEIRLEWTAKQNAQRISKMEQKQNRNLKIEGRLIKQLAELKKQGGPFTDIDEIENYMNDTAVDEMTKSSLMKMEIQYARDTSISYPKSSRLFRIRASIDGKKTWQLTAEEFAQNLSILLGKKIKACDSQISISNFVDMIWKL